MILNSEILNTFFDYTDEYLGVKVRRIAIIDCDQVVPKLDELTTDYGQYTHLFVYWETLKNPEQ
jgi:hypothetical protein